MGVVSLTFTTAGNLTFNMNASAAITAAEALAVAEYLTKIAPTLEAPAAETKPIATAAAAKPVV